MVLVDVSRDEDSGLVAIGLTSHPSAPPAEIRVLDELVAALAVSMLEAALADARRTASPTPVDLDAIVERAEIAVAALRQRR